MPETVQHQTPDKIITFELSTFETLRSDTVYRSVIDGLGGGAVNQLSELDRRRAVSFASCLSRTVSIRFDMPENPSKGLRAFADFWERNKVHRKRDYTTIYDDFDTSTPPEIYGLWCDAYNEMMETEDALKASPEIAAGSSVQASADFFSENGAEQLLTVSESS